MSLYNVDNAEWVGLQNYTDLFTGQASTYFWNALLNTFTLGVLSTVPQLLMALGLAHLLNYRLRARGFFRTALLAPLRHVRRRATLVFALIFSPEGGMANWVLSLFGADPIRWEAGRWSSQFAISTIVTWRWTGYNALIFLAAMQAVPRELYEAAALDGANRWQQFLNVTIPALRPTILFTVIVSTIGATQLFGEPYLFGGARAATRAAPITSTRPSASSCTTRDSTRACSGAPARSPGSCSACCCSSGWSTR
ncbi:hypothetical protein GCM10020295_09930 [Streptomyces cinereospinus]